MKVNMVMFARLTSYLFLVYLATETNVWGFVLGVLISHVILKIVRHVLADKLLPHGKAVFITGCDSGFGHLLALRLDQEGYQVFAGCLLPDAAGAQQLKAKGTRNLQVIPVDVTSDTSVSSAREYVSLHLGDNVLWGVVNNAGIYGHGEVELCSLDMYKSVADVNLYGMIRVTKAFLPLVRESKGRIVNISSVNGRYALPTFSPYNASKVAVETVTDSLRMEMIRFGVKVSLIEPGMFGGSTEIHSEANIKRHYTEIDISWEKFTPAVKEAYTKKYMQEQIDRIVRLRFKLDARSPDAVLDATEHALSSSDPKCRYMVHGGPFPFDPLVVYATLYGYLPESITDWLGCKMGKADRRPVH